MFMKTVKGKTSSITLLTSALSPTAAAGKKGLILILANGKKIERPEASIDLDANLKGGSSFKYNAAITLTPAEIKMLTESPMTDKRLYIFDDTFPEGTKLMELLKCLTKS